MNSNIPLPESFTAGLEVMVPVDLKHFFNAAKQQEFLTIGELTIEGLTRMQDRVKLLNELEAFLLSIRAKQKRQP